MLISNDRISINQIIHINEFLILYKEILTQIKEIMLKLITQAEVDYDNWNQAGSIKRSQVIKQIFDEYPILSTVTNQKEIIRWIESEIEYSLNTLDDIVSNSDSKSNDNTNEK